jgi:hypothetical protein
MQPAASRKVLASAPRCSRSTAACTSCN